jgi:hypothetical protein
MTMPETTQIVLNVPTEGLTSLIYAVGILAVLHIVSAAVKVWHWWAIREYRKAIDEHERAAAALASAKGGG